MSGWEWFVCVLCANVIIGVMLVSDSLPSVWAVVNADGKGRRWAFVLAAILYSLFAAPRSVFVAVKAFREALAERRK